MRTKAPISLTWHGLDQRSHSQRSQNPTLIDVINISEQLNNFLSFLIFFELRGCKRRFFLLRVRTILQFHRKNIDFLSTSTLKGEFIFLIHEYQCNQ